MEKSIKVSEKIFENIIIALAIMLYFIIINFSYYRLDQNILQIELKILSVIILLLSITIFEIAHKKDSGKIAIFGIETLIISAHALSIMHVVQIIHIKFTNYIVISSFVFVIYYILKAILLYTIDKRKYLKSLSDIKEIVNNEPIKKEATKKKVK